MRATTYRTPKAHSTAPRRKQWADVVETPSVILWGILSGLTATVHHFRALGLVRFFLGFVEAPYFTGALFLLSSWYTSSELATRTLIPSAGSLLCGGFGGLIGAGVRSGLDGSNERHSKLETALHYRGSVFSPTFLLTMITRDYCCGILLEIEGGP